MLIKELVHKDELIAQLTKEMEGLSTRRYAEMLEDLKSIPGLGKKTAMALIVLSGGFERFDDCRKLSSYTGICPRLFESGTRVKGKARICKMGMSRIRASAPGALSDVTRLVKSFMSDWLQKRKQRNWH